MDSLTREDLVMYILYYVYTIMAKIINNLTFMGNMGHWDFGA